MRMRAVILSWKIEKKGHSVDFYGPWYSLVLTEFFDIYRLHSSGFFMTILKKMTWDHFVFGRLNVFWQNMDMRAAWFLESGQFLTKYGHESIYFYVKIGEKKTISYWLFCTVFVTELMFFGPTMGMRVGGFSWKIFKNERKKLFLREWTFSDKIWA